MREIKFRGKVKKNGLWVYGCLHRDNGKCYIIRSFDNESDRDGYQIGTAKMYEVYPESVGQLITYFENEEEKPDIHRPLFENDVVEFLDTEIDKTVISVIRWIPNTYGFRFIHQTSARITLRQIKVIGNSFDNPELLK